MKILKLHSITQKIMKKTKCDAVKLESNKKNYKIIEKS